MELVGAARGAFTQAMDWVLIVSVGLTLATAVAAAVLLRNIDTSAQADARGDLDDEAA